MKTNAAAIIPAAGSGSRMNSSSPKQYLLLAGKPVLVHTVSAFHHNIGIAKIVVVAPKDMVASTREMLDFWNVGEKAEVVAGGERRQDSVMAGLNALDESIDIVLVHDGARPLISDELISQCHLEAENHGAVIAAIPVKDTLKRCNSENTIEETVNRANLWQAQTPQAAQQKLLRFAYDEVGSKEVTDEASLLELAGITVNIVLGSETNIKITRPEDLIIAEKILMQTNTASFRIGHGFDAHQLVADRALVLGGITIPYSLGLAGHSDADVVSHAVCDAILGALGKGDIGKHFPDSAAEFKDIYSILLLERVIEEMVEEGFCLGNIDITIICQAPKLAPYLQEMAILLGRTCQASEEQVNVKATTTEQMGFTGRGEGISCHAVVFLCKTL